jgi:hypothetical protein
LLVAKPRLNPSMQLTGAERSVMALPTKRSASWMSIGLVTLGCTDQNRLPPRGFPDRPMEEHTALGASFVSNDSMALRRLLHADLIVQPPLPDSAQQGAAAIEYLLGLAAQTSVSESRLVPQAVVPEGPFVFEQGAWVLRSGNRMLRAPYTLRWRATAEGWRAILWRWGAFR